MTPGLLGLSHVGLSVTDVDTSKAFWRDVLGFRIVESTPEFCFLFEDAARLAVVLTDHGGGTRGPFDHLRVGMDHVAFAVADVESLTAWQQRLSMMGIEHTPIVESDAGHHLNLRAPDNVAVELVVVKRAFLETLLGEPSELVVAGRHTL